MLRHGAKHIIVGTLTDDTVYIDSGVVRIEGYGEFNTADVLDCFNECPVACTPNVRTVTVTVPTTCECPYEWTIKIRARACNWKYDVQSTFHNDQVYHYVSQDGSTPTATVVKDAIVAQINAHEFASVTAASTGADTFTITEKDCDGLLGTCGIEAFVSSGSVANTTPFVAPILPAWRIYQQFPIQWGHQGANPELGRCANYCVYYLHIRGSSEIQDIDMASTWSDYDREVYFFVNPDDANYADYWETKLATEIPCITT